MGRLNGGDKLASGGVRCNFMTADSTVSQEKWDAIFGDYEPTKRGSSSSNEASGNASVSPRKSRQSKKLS